jgi:hypothetical protein
MPNAIVLAQVLAQAGAANVPAEAAIQAQIDEVQEQVQDLVEEIQAVEPNERVVFGSPNPGVDALITISLFVAIAGVLCFRYYLGYRTKQEVQATVRSALDRGVPITGELLDRILDTPAPKRSDLRRGVIWISLGVGLAAFSLVDFQDMWRPMLGIGLVPMLLGAAYLVLWRLGDGNAR